MQPSEQRIYFEVFKGSFKSWQGLFQEAAAFAETIDPERLIGISHSSDNSEVLTLLERYLRGSDRR